MIDDGSMTQSPQLDAVLDRLGRLHPKKIDLSLERIAALLDTLGRPQDRLPPVVHAAGTNGKGSTLAFLKAMIEAAGRRAHVYTSPHLVRFNERIVLAGESASDAALIAAFERVEAANEGRPITFFEVTTAAAFLMFSEAEADFLLLETGLGGKFDATNVVTRPAATAITPISRDHREVLGDDIVEIAREKAGIFKEGVPAFIGAQTEAVRAVLSREAGARGAPAQLFGVDFNAYGERGGMTYQDADRVLDLPAPSLRGAHQVQNAGLAAAIALSLGLPRGAIAEGVRTAQWLARLQRLTAGPFVEAAHAGGAELWLDAAHNPGGAATLAAALGELETREPKDVVLVCGAMANKDLDGIAAPFAGMAAELIAVPLKDEPNGADPGHIAAAAAEAGLRASIAPSLLAGVREAAERYPGGRIVMFGSLRLAAEALA